MNFTSPRESLEKLNWTAGYEGLTDDPFGTVRSENPVLEQPNEGWVTKKRPLTKDQSRPQAWARNLEVSCARHYIAAVFTVVPLCGPSQEDNSNPSSAALAPYNDKNDNNVSISTPANTELSALSNGTLMWMCDVGGCSSSTFRRRTKLLRHQKKHAISSEYLCAAQHCRRTGRRGFT